MTRVYIGIAIAVAIALSIAGAWFKGRDYERDQILSAQLTAAVTITGRQRAATVAEVVTHGKRKAETAARMPALQRDIVRRCLGLLPDGVQVRPGRGSTPVPAARAGDPAGVAAWPAEADQAWCRDLADDYATGAEALNDLQLCLGWIDANGGAEP